MVTLKNAQVGTGVWRIESKNEAVKRERGMGFPRTNRKHRPPKRWEGLKKLYNVGEDGGHRGARRWGNTSLKLAIKEGVKKGTEGRKNKKGSGTKRGKLRRNSSTK